MTLENSSYSVTPGSFDKIIQVPTSKSYANRVIVLAALNDDEVSIKNLPQSSDVKNMIRCLREIGVKISGDDNNIVIHNSFPECEIKSDKIIDLHTGDGGTTNRFLIPLLSLGSNKYNLIPEEKMSERPMKEMERVLSHLGVKLDNDNHWFCLQGPIQSSEETIEVDCSKTTQFATGFLLAYAHTEIIIKEKNLTTSVPYFEMTKELVSKKDQTSYIVPVDFSSLSYPLAFAALGNRVRVTNCLERDHYQADSEFIEILKNINIEVEFSKDGLSIIGKDSIEGFSHDCRACPDLIPTLCFLASYCSGRTLLKSVEVLRHKECDRLQEMLRMLKAFGIKTTHLEHEDAIEIIGGNRIDAKIDFVPERDHRMVMVCALFQKYNAGGIVSNAECVNKSFPDFFEVMM